jgi:hypothetical protein
VVSNYLAPQRARKSPLRHLTSSSVWERHWNVRLWLDHTRVIRRFNWKGK